MSSPDYTNIHTWLETFVNSKDFLANLQAAVMEIEHPAQRVKAMLDLVDYVKPKFKTIDAPSADEARSIEITYVEDPAKAAK